MIENMLDSAAQQNASEAGNHGQQVPKRKHRRGKKSKLVPKKTKNPYTGWKQELPGHCNYADGGGGGDAGEPRNNRAKLLRSRSLLVPYNTNRFLMEDHMSELAKDDSDDNCFGSQTDDQELFLSKEFSNVYERTRVERLEGLTKQQLIQECLNIEDRYTKEQRQQNLNAQALTKEFGAKIRGLEEKVRYLTRENQVLRSHLIRPPAIAAAAAAAASPPSAAAPTASAVCETQQARQHPQPPSAMDSSSEDSESDSSSTTSSTTSSTSSSSDGHEMDVAGLNIANGHVERSLAQRRSRSRSCSRSRSRSPILNDHGDAERVQLLETGHMDEDDSSNDMGGDNETISAMPK